MPLFGGLGLAAGAAGVLGYAAITALLDNLLRNRGKSKELEKIYAKKITDEQRAVEMADLLEAQTMEMQAGAEEAARSAGISDNQFDLMMSALRYGQGGRSSRTDPRGMAMATMEGIQPGLARRVMQAAKPPPINPRMLGMGYTPPEGMPF